MESYHEATGIELSSGQVLTVEVRYEQLNEAPTLCPAVVKDDQQEQMCLCLHGTIHVKEFGKIAWSTICI